MKKANKTFRRLELDLALAQVRIEELENIIAAHVTAALAHEEAMNDRVTRDQGVLLQRIANLQKDPVAWATIKEEDVEREDEVYEQEMYEQEVCE